MSSFTFEIDPCTVLGVPATANLQEIRDAYRRKSKILHPDVGGEEWAFRVLVQAYELLCTARVVRATRPEPPHPQHATPGQDRRQEPSVETVRGGIHDTGLPASRIIGLEHLCVRYLWDEAAYLWLTQKQPDEERFLSCSLNMMWPDQGAAADINEKEARGILEDLQEIFDHLIVSTRVITSRSHIGDDAFAGWLSYSNFERSQKALKTLHSAMRSRNLGLRQWSRDLYIPKNWG